MGSTTRASEVTSAGKGALRFDDPMNAGGVGVVGASSANALVRDADLLITVGTRLSDFTTGSRTVVSSGVAQININVAQMDARKHNATPLRGAMRHLRRCLSGDIAKTTTAQDRLEAQHILLRIRTLTRRTSAQQKQGDQ